ncbi:hypothetical protein [Carboxylicivirga sp. M1479]|uniref:hypothetical protein n=1 Tax=Carboxylicivirga sp. M1479 TaxID=2594476 RepID=UPI0011784DC7|nr:hypothetical protein [Carboxylicivirga sp. M1479]TRX65911.1 hypothetical protein FNN09_16090 [Carboxylicivirga sp. M1479]
MSKNDRLFNVPDATLQQHGTSVATVLPNDLEKFKFFDSTFLDSYPDTIKAAIEEVKAIKTDMVIIDEMTEKTQAVYDSAAACNRAYRTITFFVLKAFSDNKAVQNQFGANDIGKLRKDNTRLVVFMGDLIKVVNKYRVELITAGCSEVVIDSLQQLHTKLSEAKTAQELFKKERGLITQDRVKKLNDLYELLVPISEMAQIIFADDEARMARYLLPRPKSSTNSADDLIVS